MSAIFSFSDLKIHTDREYNAVLDRYGVDRNKMLGKGEYGIVCKMDGGVAKIQSPRKLNSSRERKIFDFLRAYDEAKIHIELSSRDISIVPRVRWAIVGNLRVAIGMEESGKTIYSKYLKQKSSPSFAKIRRLAFHWLKGLDEIHMVGVVHGDVKPSNLTERHLLDYGISQKLSEIDKERVVCSRWYRPPEILLGLYYDTKVDLFSLGTVLYGIYTGIDLFCVDDQDNVMEADLQHLYHFLDVMELEEFPQNLMDRARAYCILDERSQRRLLLPVKEDNRIKNPKKFLETLSQMREFRGDDEGLFALWVDLLKGLLEFDPEKRLSAGEALKHPFFVREEKGGVEEEEHKESP